MPPTATFFRIFARSHALEARQFYGRSHDAVIRVFDESGNVTEKQEQADA
jgi:hypothetical protein